MFGDLSDPEQATAPKKPKWKKRIGRWIGKIRENKRRRADDAREAEEDGEEGVQLERQPSWIGETIHFERQHDTKGDLPAKVVSERRGFSKRIPTLERWEQLGDRSIHGKIFGSDIMKDGVWLTTSPVITGCIKSWVFIRCISGERYFLGSSRADSVDRPEVSKNATVESWFSFADTSMPSLPFMKRSQSMDFTEATGVSGQQYSEYTKGSRYTRYEETDVSSRQYSEYTEGSKYTRETYEESYDGQSASTSSSFPSETSDGAWALHSDNLSKSSHPEDGGGRKRCSWMTFGWCFYE